MADASLILLARTYRAIVEQVSPVFQIPPVATVSGNSQQKRERTERFLSGRARVAYKLPKAHFGTRSDENWHQYSPPHMVKY